MLVIKMNFKVHIKLENDEMSFRHVREFSTRVFYMRRTCDEGRNVSHTESER